MNSFQRIKKILGGCLMFLCGFFFLTIPEEAYVMVVLILGLTLAVRGIRDIVYYFSFARYMVGGKVILFQGVILLDFAMLAGGLSDLPKPIVLMYLIIAHAFAGVVEVLRAMEAKRTVDGPWKLKFSHGIINFLLSLFCLVMIRRANIPVLVFSLSLMYSGVMWVIDAFRRTTFILIK